MPHLLIEILSEEIPARMQARAEADLRKLVLEGLAAFGLRPEAARAFSTPRRLGLAADGLPLASAPVVEERKGPRVGAPEAAILGFIKAAGLASIHEADIVDDKKGQSYVARIHRQGREAAGVLAEIVPSVLKAFPWPKSMRSGSGDLAWVRPIRNVLVMFDGQPVAIDLEGVPNRPETFGHRFHAPQAIPVRRFEDYERKLRQAFVMLEREERKATIVADARTLCAARNLELVEDMGLLEETAGLVEWPVALMGDMNPAFLDLPSEVIRLTMRTHQKYFAVRDPKTRRLAPHFVTVANIEAKDGGGAIAAGNARVLSARLNDARFFWAKDQETPLYTDERREKLKGLVFHARLGSVWDKVERVGALARDLAPICGADPDLCEQAARLAKMDLVAETVGEFPELQGQIGRLLYEAGPAHSQKEGQDSGKSAHGGHNAHPSIAAAIEDHYRPLGPNDRVPTDPVAVTLALADKLDSLVGFWAIDEKPTGSGDAFGSRRAALGVLRILLDNAIPLELQKGSILVNHGLRYGLPGRMTVDDCAPLIADLTFGFLLDRLTVSLREQGFSPSSCAAAFDTRLSGFCPLDLRRRVEALDAFLKTDAGKSLLAGYKRAANILAQEEKRQPGLAQEIAAAPAAKNLLLEDAEKALFDALKAVAGEAQKAMAQGRFAEAMTALASLRGPVDALLDGVLVNDKDKALRLNRLRLLAEIRSALRSVANFSKIEG